MKTESETKTKIIKSVPAGRLDGPEWANMWGTEVYRIRRPDGLVTQIEVRNDGHILIETTF